MSSERLGALPRVDYSKQVLNSPYRVNFDVEKYAQLLLESGVSSQDVSRMRVNVKGNSPLGALQGTFNLITGSISIYAGDHYRHYFDKESPDDFSKVNEELDCTLRHEAKHCIDRKNPLVVGLSRVSTVSPMVAVAALAYFVHNPMPAFIDLQDRLPEAVFWGESLVGALIVGHEFEYYFLNIMERRARKFEKETREWSGIITMEPK